MFQARLRQASRPSRHRRRACCRRRGVRCLCARRVAPARLRTLRGSTRRDGYRRSRHWEVLQALWRVWQMFRAAVRLRGSGSADGRLEVMTYGADLTTRTTVVLMPKPSLLAGPTERHEIVPLYTNWPYMRRMPRKTSIYVDAGSEAILAARDGARSRSGGTAGGR